MITYEDIKILTKEEDYFTSGLIGSSDFAKLKVNKKLLGTQKITASLSNGSALHCMLLEKENFNDKFVICDTSSEKTKKYTECAEANPNKTVITATFHEEMLKMYDVLRENSYVMGYINSAIYKELPFYGKLIYQCYANNTTFDNQAEGFINEILATTGTTDTTYNNKMVFPVRFKPDFVCIDEQNSTVTIGDYKTCRDNLLLTADDWSRHCRKYNYDLQAYHYLNGFTSFHKELSKKEYKYEFIHIVQSKEAPYLVRRFKLINILNSGHYKLCDILNKYNDNFDDFVEI